METIFLSQFYFSLLFWPSPSGKARFYHELPKSNEYNFLPRKFCFNLDISSLRLKQFTENAMKERKPFQTQSESSRARELKSFSHHNFASEVLRASSKKAKSLVSPFTMNSICEAGRIFFFSSKDATSLDYRRKPS